MKKTLILVMALFILAIPMVASATTIWDMKAAPPGLDSTGYKNIPANNWTVFFLKKFDAAAEKNGVAGGSDWFKAIPATKSPAAVSRWWTAAKESGWQVSVMSRRPMAGALGLIHVQSNYGGTISVILYVDEVRDNGVQCLVLSNDGEERSKFYTWDELQKRGTFQGWIYPLKNGMKLAGQTDEQLIE